MNHALSRLPKLSFGALIKEERERQGLSHRDISVRCSVDRETVKSWERGESFPTRIELKKLFGSLQRLRHYVHLLPTAVQHEATADAKASGAPLPEQLAPIASAVLPFPKTFGEALKRARLHEGLGQDELGEMISVTGQAVSYWETETNTPILDHYNALLDLLPALNAAPKPVTRDIDKPGGYHTGERSSEPEIAVNFYDEQPTKENMQGSRGSQGHISAPTDVAPIRPAPKPAEIVNEDQQMRHALIRWGRLVHALKTQPNAHLFTDFLAEANDAGMTLADVISALDNPK